MVNSKKKKATVTQAKQKAWNIFSKYIRTRGSKNNWNSCFTCLRSLPVKELQAGHWLPGRHNSVLFDPRNCHSQCMRCNVFLKGNPVFYYDRMLEIYGSEICEELKALDRTSKQFKVFELLEIEEEYKQKLEKLLGE